VAQQLLHTAAFMSDRTRLMNQMDADILNGRRLEELVMTCLRCMEATAYNPRPQATEAEQLDRPQCSFWATTKGGNLSNWNKKL
jgi:hypothetical protein